MKKVLGLIAQIVLVPIFAALFLGLLFLMPAELVVSSWHLVKADASTTGRLDSSQVGRSGNRGTTRSEVSYHYEVNEREYASTRLSPGFTHRAYETGGGGFARSHFAGSDITVYYDSKHPEFSFVDRGWPKWSIGFTMAVWGMIASGWNRLENLRHRSQLPLFAASQSILWTGFLTLFFMDSVIAPHQLLTVTGTGVVTFAGALAYGRVKFRPSKELKLPGD